MGKGRIDQRKVLVIWAEEGENGYQMSTVPAEKDPDHKVSEFKCYCLLVTLFSGSVDTSSESLCPAWAQR